MEKNEARVSAAVFISVPVVIIVVALQKYLAEGLTAGSVKG